MMDKMKGPDEGRRRLLRESAALVAGVAIGSMGKGKNTEHSPALDTPPVERMPEGKGLGDNEELFGILSRFPKNIARIKIRESLAQIERELEAINTNYNEFRKSADRPNIIKAEKELLTFRANVEWKMLKLKKEELADVLQAYERAQPKEESTPLPSKAGKTFQV